MKNLSPLQKKYEVATLQNWIAEQQYNRIEFLVNRYLTEAPAIPAQQPASQQTQPRKAQQAVQQIPKQQLPSLIDQLVGQIAKTNPQAFAELQAAVQSNNINAINQIIKKYSAQAPVKETTIEEVIIDECVKYAYVNKDFVTIQKLHEFVRSGGDTRIITEHISNNCSPDNIIEAYQELYSEAEAADKPEEGGFLKTIGKGIASGLGNMFSRLGKFVGKYGPWSALGWAMAGPAGATVVPLVKAALNKWSGSVGSTTASTTDKDKKTDTTTPQQDQQPVQQDKKPTQQQPVQPVQPAQQEPVQQPAQQQPVQPVQPVQQPAQQEPVQQPAQQEPVQPAQQANVNVVPPDTTVAAVPTTAPTEPPVVDIDAKDVTPGPTATPVSSAAVVPATDTRIRRARPMKTVTPTEPPRTINEFQSAFQKAINEFKRSSAESPIEKANRK